MLHKGFLQLPPYVCSELGLTEGKVQSAYCRAAQPQARALLFGYYSGTLMPFEARELNHGGGFFTISASIKAGQISRDTAKL